MTYIRQEQNQLQPQQQPVPQGHAVELKAGAPGGAVAPGPHGIAGDDASLQCPVREGGEDGHAIRHFFLEAVLPGHALADAAAAADDLPGLTDKVGDHPQNHHQKQGQGGDEAAEEGGEFIAGEHGVVAAEPHYHAQEHGGYHHAVAEGFPGIGPAEHGEQHVQAAQIEQGVYEGNNQKHGQQRPEHPQTLPAVEHQVVHRAAQKAGSQIDRVLDDYGKADGPQEKEEIHQGMILRKAIHFFLSHGYAS